MRISSVRVDDIEDIDRNFAPRDDSRFRTYLRDRYEATTKYLAELGGSLREDFMSRSREIFDKFNSSEALARARASMRSHSSAKRAEVIVELDTVEDLRSASLTMQRFVLADPVIRRPYLQQQLDGYSDTYLNVHGNDIGHAHYDYRRAVDGMYIEEVDEHGEAVITRNVYYEELIEGDRHLHVDEQIEILNTWDFQRAVHKAGLDPTDRLAE